MILNALQKDAVTELANIGISRATQQLATLLGDEVRMNVPKIEWLNAEEFENEIQQPSKEVACVYQNISGKINGSAALLLYPEDSQALLAGLFPGNEEQESLYLQQYQYEAIMEIANIIISSCISAMADTLCLELSVSLPNYCKTDISHLVADNKEFLNQNAILIHAKMESAKQQKGGQILILLSDGVANQILNTIPDF